MTISLKTVMYSALLNNTDLTGSPTTNGNPIISVGSSGDLESSGSPVNIKTREYKLPSTWYGILEYTKESFYNDQLYYGFGVDVFPQIDTTVIYVDPSSATNGVGTLLSPYNILPATIPNFALVLFKEYTTYNVSTQINITASNVIFGTYDQITGERVVDYGRLAIIKYGSVAKLFNYSVANSTFTISGLIFDYTGTTPNTNCVINNGVATITVNVEYCIFANINTLVGNVLSSVIETTGNLHIRFNKFYGCIAHSIVSYGKQAKIYGNEIIYSAPSSAFAIKISNSAFAGAFDIHRNYIVNNRNISSLINVANGTNGSTIVRKNYLFGGNSINSYNVLCQGTAESRIYENISTNSSTGISATTGKSTIYKNIVCSEHATFSGIHGEKVIANTICKIGTLTGGTAITATGEVRSNIIDGSSTARFQTGIIATVGIPIETNNIFQVVVSALYNDTSAVLLSQSNSIVSSMLDYKFSPFNQSTAINSAPTNTLYGLTGNRGAIQNTISGIGYR